MNDDPAPEAVDSILQDLSVGCPGALDRLTPFLYRELRHLAALHMQGERLDHTLQPTALVHEVYLRLVDRCGVPWHGRAHFLGVAGRVMRQVLVDYARAKKAQKRGAGWERLSVTGLAARPEASFDLLALDDALERLTAENPRQAQVVEIRFFGGLTAEETASVLNLSRRSVERDWRYAQVALYRFMIGREAESSAGEHE